MFITELTKNVISTNFQVIIISLYLKRFWQKKKKKIKEEKKKELPLPLVPINEYIFFKGRI